MRTDNIETQASGKRYYWCMECGEWVKADGIMDAESKHCHSGVCGCVMCAEPVGLRTVSDEVGIRPIFHGKKWRAYNIEVVTGYSQSPSWGHEAGQTLYYTYSAFRNADWDYVEADSREALISILQGFSYLTKEHTYLRGAIPL